MQQYQLNVLALTCMACMQTYGSLLRTRAFGLHHPLQVCLSRSDVPHADPLLGHSRQEYCLDPSGAVRSPVLDCIKLCVMYAEDAKPSHKTGGRDKKGQDAADGKANAADAADSAMPSATKVNIMALHRCLDLLLGHPSACSADTGVSRVLQ